MPSVVYNSAVDDMAHGFLKFSSDAFKVMLVTSGYTPDKDLDTKRSDVTDEVIGYNYVDGGRNVSVSVLKNTANDRVDITLGGTDWGFSTITAAGAVYYKAHGGAASADELVAFVDFGGDVASTNGTFTLTSSTLRIQN